MIWQGRSPTGMQVLVEREASELWIVTVAGCSRSRRESLRDAFVDDGGGTLDSGWIESIARRLETSQLAG